MSVSTPPPDSVDALFITLSSLLLFTLITDEITIAVATLSQTHKRIQLFLEYKERQRNFFTVYKKGQVKTVYKISLGTYRPHHLIQFFSES